jgi:DNA-binding CsgD family transcriptional regulator
VHDAIARLYGAVAAPQEWPAALEHVTDLLRADHAILLGRGSPGGYPVVASVRMDPQTVARFRAPETVRNSDFFLRLLPVGVAISRVDVVSDRDFENTWAYNEIVRQADGFQSMHAHLDGCGNVETFANFCRARRTGAFSSAETQALQTLLPHLTNALALLRRLSAIERQNADLLQVLEQLHSGVVLVDAAAQLCFANRPARQIIAEADGLTAGPSGLLAATPRATQALRDVIADMAAPDGIDGGSPAPVSQPVRVRLPRPSLRPPLLLSLHPIWRIGGAALVVPRPRIGIFISEPDVRRPIDRDALVEAFGLTPRECALVKLLADGHDLRVAAQLLAIGIGTARNHLKHAFEKTNTHNQATLLAALRGFVGPAC